MALLKAFLLALGLVVAFLIWSARKAGRRQLPASILARGRPLVQVTSGSPGEGWQGLGARTVTDGLNLRFDHDDDARAAVGDWIEVADAPILEICDVRSTQG